MLSLDMIKKDISLLWFFTKNAKPEPNDKETSSKL